MNNDDKIVSFRDRMEEARRKVEAKKRAQGIEPEPVFEPEVLIPDLGSRVSEEDQQLTNTLKGISILDAYVRLSGKSQPQVHGNATESIKVSCPNPAHPDKHPSAWLNTQKNVWNCAACDMGGDIYDIAAWHFNYAVPDYKTNGDFPRVQEELANAFGYYVTSTLSGTTVEKVVEVEPESEPEPAQLKVAPEPSKRPEKVVELHPIIDLNEPIFYPELKWEKFVPPGTFLDSYLRATSEDDISEEYHFWNGMIALGLAVGRTTTLFDFKPVLPNIFVCILGETGSGKSKSVGYLKRLLTDALPFDFTQDIPLGARFVASVASGEALIHVFHKDEINPTTGKATGTLIPIRGVVDFNELSAFTARTARMGNSLKDTLMQFFDGDERIATISLTHGEKVAHNPFTSTITSTQPKSLKRLLTQNEIDSGFLNRWIFVAAKPKRRVAVGGALVDLVEPIEKLQRIHGWAGTTGRQLQWSDDALARFDNYFHETLQPLKKGPQAGLVARIDLLCKKLILLFGINQMRPYSVELEDVENAIICTEYIIECYNIPFEQLSNPEENEIAQKIISVIEKYEAQGKVPNLSQIKDGINYTRYQPEKLTKVLKAMEDLEIVHLERVKVRGQMTKRYYRDKPE